MTDQKAVMERALLFFTNAKNGVDILAETLSPPQPVQSEADKKVAEAYFEIGKRGGRLRVLTRIDEGNVAYSKEVAKAVELRHLDDVKGNFAITDAEYLSSPTSGSFQPGAMVTVIYSNAKQLIEQNRSVFEAFWRRGQPAAERIAEVEEGRPHRETRIIRGEEVLKFIGPFLSRAAATKPEPYAYGVSDLHSTARAAQGQYYEVSRQLLEQNPGFRIRHITNVQKENLDAVRRLLEIGYDVRHIDGNRIRFSISKDEYIEVIHSEVDGGVADEIVWSNDPQVIGQATRMFDALWETATPASIRVREMEQGVPNPMLQIIRDPHQIQTMYLDLVKQAREEILIILPTANAFHRQERIGAVEALEVAALERGVKISMVTPNSVVQETLQALGRKIEEKVGKNLINHRRITEAYSPNTVTVLIVDRKSSLVIELRDDTQQDFERANDVATYSTRNSTVVANIRFFERMWEEVELREREEALLEREKRSRRAAELLQDILSHDIRNYNQISKSSAELLKADAENRERMTLIDSILKATDGSSELIERTKHLGRIISQESIRLRPVSLEEALRRSVELVARAHPQKQVDSTFHVEPGAKVMADDLLEEAFTNVLSNSVNYTEGAKVPIRIEVEQATLPADERQYWKVTFTDQGKGIPDEMKENVFTRYLEMAHGSGLGMSIVHALVVERYHGKVRVSDRVQGDYTKGTKMEIWLPRRY